MKRFEVVISVIHYYVVEVEAKNHNEAEAKALSMPNKYDEDDEQTRQVVMIRDRGKVQP